MDTMTPGQWKTRAAIEASWSPRARIARALRQLTVAAEHLTDEDRAKIRALIEA